MRLALGIFLAALAAYVWGFIYWGAAGTAYSAWKDVPNDEAVMQVLRENFPENGTYYLPGMDNEEATAQRLFEKGPVAFVHILARDGRPMMDPSIMVQGFILYLVASGLFALLLQRLEPASFSETACRVAYIAALAAFVIQCGDAVWWQVDWGWKLYQAFFDFVAITLMGVVLAKFTGGAGAAQT